MPSPIGHALGGVAVAWIADLMPGRAAGGAGYPAPISRLSLASLPIGHRTVTHSLGAVVAVGLFVIIAAAVTGKVTGRIALTCVAAYASHLLLDWLQADPTPPYGLQLLWPISSTWFLSGWNVFLATDRRHFLELATMKRNAVAVAQELVVLGPLVAALWLVRVKALAGLSAELSSGDHPAQ